MSAKLYFLHSLLVVLRKNVLSKRVQEKLLYGNETLYFFKKKILIFPIGKIENKIFRKITSWL